MGEIIAREYLDEAGLGDEVLVRSCGIGGWHVGQGADERAAAELSHAGYDPTHSAAQLGAEHDDATLYIAMDTGHINDLVSHGVRQERIRLMRSFDPDAPEGAIVEDPYYGSREDFTVARKQIEAAMPGLVDYARQLLEEASGR